MPGTAGPGSCPRCRARCQLAPEDAGGDRPTWDSAHARDAHPAQPVLATQLCMRGWARPLQPFWGEPEDQVSVG